MTEARLGSAKACRAVKATSDFSLVQVVASSRNCDEGDSMMSIVLCHQVIKLIQGHEALRTVNAILADDCCKPGLRGSNSKQLRPRRNAVEVE
jgi:hypothetical protein